MPGKKFDDEFSRAQRHHVFVGSHGTVRYQGHITDTPVRFHDIDGDAIPEIFTDQACDGVCKMLWDVSARPKVIASFGGH